LYVIPAEAGIQDKEKGQIQEKRINNKKTIILYTKIFLEEGK